VTAVRKYPQEIVDALGGYPPTDEQWNAVSMPLEPYVVIAGAGSGKTSVMAARVVYLALVATGRLEAAHDGVMPGNVLALTFTKKATENLMLRIRHALRAVDLAEGEEPEIRNYHSFAAHLLERYGLLAGIEPGQRVLTPAQCMELCARVLDQMTFKDVRSGWQPALIANILGLAEQMANHRVTPEQAIAFNQGQLAGLRGARSSEPYTAALQRIELARAVELFERMKKDLGAIDFGDQIALALRVLEQHPEVGEEYRSRFHTALLDEYQDTNVAQAQLIRGVFGGGFPVTAVGDPDQNIYAWRGATLFNLLDFPKQFPPAGAEKAAKLPLYMNFRSGARILAAADTLISALPAEQRPDPDKRLEPCKTNGRGEVHIERFEDEWAEAGWTARRIVELHKDGTPWSGFAVLCRTSRLFDSLQLAFAEQDIPVEFVDLAGLLKTPEIVEILAYTRAAADPFASVALGRILLGPRWRVGFKDLALVAGWTKGRNWRIRSDEHAESESTEFLFAEALEHLGEIEGLSEEGSARLEEFLAELREFRVLARKPVGEFLAEIVRRIGLLAELDADLDGPMALAARRNIASFLDQVHAFSPVEGELSLRAFLDYVDAMDELDKQEWSSAQPGDGDSVKVMTIHKAKGLEFDTVFVPGLAHDLLPNTRIQQNPASRGHSLDFDLRGDADILPKFGGVMKTFREQLKEQELMEERRTCYVALTRAKRRLFVTGAWWYGQGKNTKRPSPFFEELAGWGETKSGRSGAPATVVRGPDEPPENPLAGYRQRFVRPWPGPALRPGEADELFPRGWRRAALEAVQGSGVTSAAVTSLPPGEHKRFDELAAEKRTLAAHLIERECEADTGIRIPSGVSVSGLVTYARCPKRFYWTSVRPLPTFGGPAARLGTRIHQWIEQQAAGQASLIDLEEEPDLVAEELAGKPGTIERLHENFLASRFGKQAPLFAERPFMLSIGGFAVNGRIDAIYGELGGRWEVVDYKTGRVPPEDDPLAGWQLDLYSLACVEIWGKRPEDLTLAYFYLAEPTIVERAADAPDVVRTRVEQALSRVGAREFDPSPGEHCHWCDFLPFCEAGKTEVAGHTLE